MYEVYYPGENESGLLDDVSIVRMQAGLPIARTWPLTGPPVQLGSKTARLLC